jgi:FKBP-type peptidyl-prolyl cis-trans isomerase
MSGVVATLLKGDNGRRLVPGDRVVVSYVCALSVEDLLAGNYVDCTEWQSAPVEVTVGAGELLSGLESVVSDACLGDTLRVEVPPEAAFGKRGIPGRIPSNARLIFDIELSTPLPSAS